MEATIRGLWLSPVLVFTAVASPVGDHDLQVRAPGYDSSFLNPLISGLSQDKCPLWVTGGFVGNLVCAIIRPEYVKAVGSFNNIIGVGPVCVNVGGLFGADTLRSSETCRYYLKS
jgi:hypothetical protein